MVDEPLHSHEEELRECEKVSALWLCSGEEGERRKKQNHELQNFDLSLI